jgi:hypothetical protein
MDPCNNKLQQFKSTRIFLEKTRQNKFGLVQSCLILTLTLWKREIFLDGNRKAHLEKET